MFDVAGAKAAGYTDAEIQQFLMEMPETAEAKKAGYTDAEIMQHFGLTAGPVKSTGGLTLKRTAEVGAREVAPLAAAAGAGALLGGPAGAALAAGGLEAADLATSLYNIAAPKFGGQPVRTPSEIVRGYITPESFKPRTQAEELAAAGIGGTAEALTGAGAANIFARRVAPGMMRNALMTMAERPAVQAGAGAVGAAAPVRAEQMGVEDPRALLATSLVGGLAGAHGAAGLQRGLESGVAAAERGALRLAGKPPSTEALGERASQAFETAKSYGVQYDPVKYQSFVGDLPKSLPGYYPEFSKFDDVKTAINELKKLESEPITIDRLHEARQMIGELRSDENKKIRRLGGILTDKLDDFITNSKNATGADSKEAADALMSGIKDYKMMSKSSEIERLIDRADLSGGSAENIQSQFRSLAKNEGRMRKFTPDEQTMIKRIAKGEEGSMLANLASKFAPSRSPGMLATQALVGGYGLSSDDPYAFYGAGGAALAGAAGRAVRNAMTRRAAANVAAMTRGAPTAVPFSVQYAPLAMPLATQGVNAMAR